MSLKTGCAFVAFITWGFAAYAADPDGNYAVRGTGALPCSAFLEASQGPTGSIDLFVRWFEGYLSAANRMLPDTYDASPFVEMRDVSLLVFNVCTREQQDIRLEAAFATVLDALYPIRDTEQSDVVTAEHDGIRALIRESTMARLQEILTEMELYTSTVDGLYGPGTRAALLRYQEERGLDQTGVPDRATVISILTAE